MKTRGYKPNKVALVTLGCSKNTVDSEVLMAQLKAGEVNAVHEETEGADTIIINTCGFIDNAKQESIETILDFAQRKREGEIQRLLVTGCLSERYREELINEIPEVDGWHGTFDLPKLLKGVGVDYKKELIGERTSSVSKHFAYMKISEGCDRPCSFCAIPLMRGKHVSRPIADLVQEAKKLASEGVVELMLIAQDSTYYGIDLYGERKLDQLLDELSQVEGLKWIRLHYAYPSKFPFEILPIMRERDNICNYIDIPIQHIADSVLKSMRRGITKRRTLEVLQRIRTEVPGIAIRTTLLLGHPGETEEAFEELKEFIQDFRFDRLGVFTYSHEEGTHAHTLEDSIPQEVKDQRAEDIMAIQYEISLEKNQSLIGQELNVLVERIDGDHYVARTEYDSAEVDNEVLIPLDSAYLRTGDFVKCKITEASAYDLHAKPIL